MIQPNFLELLYKNKFEVEEKLLAIVNDEIITSEGDGDWYHRRQELQLSMFRNQKTLIDNLIAKYLEVHK